MNITDLTDVLNRVREMKPLVHHITNYVSVNDCANVVLAAGASPVMADELDEIDEIVSISSALVINIGTLNKRTIESMIEAMKKANEKGIPAILDPVGAGASTIRTETAKKLVKENKFAVIKGNISEIKVVNDGQGFTRGVDADAGNALNNNIENMKVLAKNLAAKTGSIVVITGAVDVVSDGKRCCLIHNGHPMMSKITGTGCMCASLVGAFCGAEQDYFKATVAAILTMSLAGQLAFDRLPEPKQGSGSYRRFIIDEISCMNDEKLARHGRVSFENEI